MSEINNTTRMYPRTMAEAFPKDVVSEVFEGPYRGHYEASDFAVLMAIIFVITMLVVGFDLYLWRP